MRTRRLTLAKESLTELCTDEMENVVGAAAQQITPIAQCVENVTSKVINCLSVFDPCPTR
ncbi:MAG TPA: hypothetical protein VGX28_02120 [Frankiaceae bacterium]|jgi:hypothetical protein|nr:hypothetical protein [Frankiaceae bacterium]